MAHPRRWLLALVVLLIIAGVAISVWAYRAGITPEILQAWVASLGIWAPVGFVLLYGLPPSR